MLGVRWGVVLWTGVELRRAGQATPEQESRQGAWHQPGGRGAAEMLAGKRYDLVCILGGSL